ncbi:hypothetical protein JCM10213_003951 [Rhodosporidiobolus nylandii]
MPAAPSDSSRSPSPPPKRVDKGKGKAVARASDDEDEDADGDAGMHDGTDGANGTQTNGAEDDEMDVSSPDEEEEDDGLTREQKDRKKDERKQKKKKELRAKYRMLQNTVDDARGDLANTSVDALSAQVAASNALFRKVDAPSEAILDSRVLIATSEAGALKARQLKIDADAFDTDEFLSRLKAFLGVRAGGVRTRRQRGDDSDDELDDAENASGALKWGRVGKVLAGESKRVPALDFMYGPLALEIKEKKARTQRAKNKADDAERVRPEELHAEDVAKNENETGKVTARIAKRLAEVAGTDGIPYLQFVVNPDSFSQTVENMFYFSFLMRENKAAIEVDDNTDSPYYGDMITFSVDAETTAAQAEQGSSAKKYQVVLELTEEVWRVGFLSSIALLLPPARDAIEAYDITEPLIPSRDAFVPPTKGGAFKW